MKTLDNLLNLGKNIVYKGKYYSKIGLLCLLGTEGLIYQCASTKYYDNYKNPKEFAQLEAEEKKEKKEPYSDLIATLGSVLMIVGDTEKDQALGAALSTLGTLKSNKEAAEIGKAEVNIQIAPQPVATAPDATSIPEYDLKQLEEIYNKGHLIKKENTDFFDHTIFTSKIDGLQFVFTFNRVLDLDFNGFDFNEYIGVKRNFRQGEKLGISIGYRGSAIKVVKEQRKFMFDKFGPRKTTTTINLKVLDENNSLIKEKSYKKEFFDYNKDEIILENLETSDLKPGFYLIEVRYSSDYNPEKDKRSFFYMNKEIVHGAVIKNLRQYFQILPSNDSDTKNNN